jgi:hypothetical protein|tara:strand:- start:44794 stop:45048 length:255 start_codon:yes stop_codon:yes gene_type:complete
MAVDIVKLAPESFQTIYLRKEDRVILRTEQGRKIIIKRIIPDEWKEWKVYDQELALNDNKKEIFLIDSTYLPIITKEFARKIRN